MYSKLTRIALLFFLAAGFSLPAFAQRPTAITVSPATGLYGYTTTPQATLTANKAPVVNQRITFTLNGAAVGSAVTNSSGVATLSNASLSGIPVNTYPNGITAVFAGTSSFRASQ